MSSSQMQVKLCKKIDFWSYDEKPFSLPFEIKVAIYLSSPGSDTKGRMQIKN